MSTWKCVAGHIPFRKVDIWLRGFRSIWVSTTRPNGKPHAVPVWYIWDGECIYFLTGDPSQKAKNLAKTPFAVVHGGDGDDAIILEGPVEPLTDAKDIAWLNEQYMEKYVDPHSGAHATASAEGAFIYRVRVKRILCWEYGAVGTRTEWRKEFS